VKVQRKAQNSPLTTSAVLRNLVGMAMRSPNEDSNVLIFESNDQIIIDEKEKNHGSNR
jgi:hypothetical protein